MEREGKRFPAIADALLDAEKDAANRPPPGIVPRTSIPAIIKAADANDDDDDEVQAEIAAAKKAAKKKAKKANTQQKQGGNGSLPQANSFPHNGGATSKPKGNYFNTQPPTYKPRYRNPGRPCSFCQNDTITDPSRWHWDNKCPTRPKGESMCVRGEMDADVNAISASVSNVSRNHLNF
jgi:hypothetical protein